MPHITCVHVHTRSYMNIHAVTCTNMQGNAIHPKNNDKAHEKLAKMDTQIVCIKTA